ASNSSSTTGRVAAAISAPKRSCVRQRTATHFSWLAWKRWQVETGPVEASRVPHLCGHGATTLMEVMVQLTQTRAVSTSLPVLCLIVVGRKLNRPPFEQSAHLLAWRRRVHASISCEVAVRDRADERRSGKRFEQPQHDVGPGLADPCEHVSKRNPHRF